MYADWLDEHGDRDRAEFIRAQVELADRNLDVDRALALRRRERVLLEAHGPTWQQPFGKEQSPRFTRGFVSELSLSAVELFAHGREYLDAAPVTSVVLRDAGEEAEQSAELSRCDALNRLQSLNFYYAPIGEESARALFGSPPLRRLRGLHLGEGDATPDTVSVLAQHLAELRELYLWDFHEGALGDDGLTILAHSPAFTRLTTLNLLQTGASADGARAVAESPHLRHLESLSFGFQACGYAPNFIGPEGIRHLARSAQLAGLWHLGLGLTRAGSDGVRELTASPHLNRLTSLELGLNEVRTDGAAELADWPGLGGVRWLNLSSNDIGSEGAAALARSPRVTKLETLGLSGCRVGTDGIRTLAESPHLDRLRTLWLGHGLEADAIEILLGNNRFAQLAELHLGGQNESQRARLKARFGDRVWC